MANYFETKVTFDKVIENGAVKKVTEPYLVDALSFTEAEARTIEEVSPFMSGDFTVKACRRTRITEIFNPGAERYYLAKLAFITIDEKSATEKRSVSQILVGAESFGTAITNLYNGMKGTMADFEIVSIAETQIMDVLNTKQVEREAR